MAESTPRRRRRAASPEEDERELISLTVDLARRQLKDGTASSQVMTHYLKLASSREKLEQENLRLSGQLMAAKKGQIDSMARAEELLERATEAITSYKGRGTGATP